MPRLQPYPRWHRRFGRPLTVRSASTLTRPASSASCSEPERRGETKTTPAAQSTVRAGIRLAADFHAVGIDLFNPATDENFYSQALEGLLRDG